MMREVVDHGDAAGDSADFHAPFDSFKRVEGRLDLLVGKAAVFGGGYDSEGVAHVQLPNESDTKLKAGRLKLAGRGSHLQIERLHGVVRSEAESFHWTEIDVQER